MRMAVTQVFSLLLVVGAAFPAFARQDEAKLYAYKIQTPTKELRNKISSLGLAIDAVYSDSVGVIATEAEAAVLSKAGFRFEKALIPSARSNNRGFPSSDSAFHDYAEMSAAVEAVAKNHPAIAAKISIGKSLEGRELWGLRLSSAQTQDSLPTAILMGCHHAREHLSVEVPLKLAEHLASKYNSDPQIKKLIDTREIYIIPMINPDGAEHDISGGGYKWWRKNRRNNGDGTFGVDLNRNYGTGFGGEGSSSSTSSDIYHGPHAFSEPETQAVREFVRSRKKTTVLLSFHTFSELVLWPWGHKEDAISDNTDRKVFESMGQKMASWNKYKPQQSSDLYVASGDTTDWAYDELKIFAFTFELSPSSLFGGGFYPGAAAITPTFNANLQPMLYLIEQAENPYATVR